MSLGGETAMKKGALIFKAGGARAKCRRCKREARFRPDRPINEKRQMKEYIRSFGWKKSRKRGWKCEICRAEKKQHRDRLAMVALMALPVRHTQQQVV